jgi:energy-coupling factor transporter ATP-binding protein EcfA2
MRGCGRSSKQGLQKNKKQEAFILISLIIGNKGSGKTKHLIDLVNKAVENSKGNVVCIEKETKLTHDVNYRARLIATDHFGITGYDSFFGFLCGICAGDYDITDIFIDATLKIGGKDYKELAEFLKKVSQLSKTTDNDLTFTISTEAGDLPHEIFEYCKKI